MPTDTPKGPDPVTAINLRLHELLHVEPCVTACTHTMAEWTALGVANVAGRTVDLLIAAKVAEAVAAERDRLAGYFDERSKSPVLDDWDRGYITAWRAASRRVAALAESEPDPEPKR